MLLTTHMAPTRNIKIVIEYDGAGLAGWQRQADQPTVQGHLESAMARLTGETVSVQGAGRTDAGVHARGQCAHFRTTSDRTPAEIIRGGNALLPGRIAILSAEEVPLDFHARFSAKSKIYDYLLDLSPTPRPLRRRYAWHTTPHLDLTEMERALSRLRGEHDFAAFQSTGSPVKTSIRHMMAVHLQDEKDDLVRLTFQADGFLRHMVRALVGTLVLVGRKRICPDEFEKILESGQRKLAGPTAPAHGLYLVAVQYR